MELMDFEENIEPPNRWIKILYYIWKVFTCLFLHLILIAIVVGYCFFGAHMFRALEQEYEAEMKKNISYIRKNITRDIWYITNNSNVLEEKNWTMAVREKLKLFEDQLVWCMRKGGWDGNDKEDSLKWTNAGALFYSIIVITTIGYGHIAPKTAEGKIATIFYAVVGIPLMLLCLSNIGDVMAHSFRFLYWRVCCYKCTQPPRRLPPPPLRRSRSYRTPVRPYGRFGGRSRTTSLRQSGRNSQRSADSAIGMSDGYTRSSYSDTECRYYDESEREHAMLGERLYQRQSQQSRYSDNASIYRHARHPQQPQHYRYQPAAQSQIDKQPATTVINQRTDSAEQFSATSSPVIFNKYALDRDDSRRIHSKWSVEKSKYHQSRREQASHQSYLEETSATPRASQHSNNPSINRHPSRYRRDRPHSASSLGGKSHKENIGPSPRILSPLGFAVHRQTFPRPPRDYFYYEDFYDYYYDYADSYYNADYTKPVPIWLCVFLVISYILGGAFLFDKTESDWGYFNSAYFCFITLTTIGFGDFVPKQKSGPEAEISIAICSLYLLFGIALLAMSFNLVQEEVINNVKSVARHLGIIKDEDENE